MKVIKRSGAEVDFNKEKIISAITRANNEVEVDKLSDIEIENIADDIEQYCASMNRIFTVEEIQDFVEEGIINLEAYELVRTYIKYRHRRDLIRQANTTDKQILTIIKGENELAKQENSNKNPIIISTQRDYMAGEVSRDIVRRFIMPKKIMDAHDNGAIHVHDTDYISQKMFNCCLINLDDMLQNGTVISGTMIEKPKSFITACNIATQIIAQVASNQLGGQTISLTHLAPFVDISRKKIREQVEKDLDLIQEISPNCDYHSKEHIINKLVEKKVKDEIRKGVQIIQYQVVTLMTTNGQAPFLTVFMYLNEARNEQEKEDLELIIEEVLKQRIQGVKNEKGVWITTAFPKLIYVLEEDNIKEDSKYWYLTELAAKCTAKRMVPDYISEKVMKEEKINRYGVGDCYGAMGCRSFLTPWTTEGNPSKALNYKEGEGKYYGRFNCGVVTINLAYIGLLANKDLDKFWNIFDEYLELCHEALKIRHKTLRGALSDVSPIHWQYGAIARLNKGETIDKLLYNNYCTISLGYAALWECVYSLINKKLTQEEGKELGLKIMQKMNDKCAEWKKEENIGYSLYGTPIESTTYKFAKAIKNKFGEIRGVSDKDYITNSYHIHVTEKIDAFEKLKLEAEFQKLSPGGKISYIETPNMQNNIEAVLEVMKFIYNNIMYAELNSKSDYCQVCGWDGEIQIINKDNKLIWHCPNCGNEDQTKMNIARRVCGYISTNQFNQGRTQEIKERVVHIGNE